LILPDQRLEERVNTLNILAEIHFYKDAKQGIQYTDEAIKLAKELNYNKGIADALRNYGGISFMRGDFALALNDFLDALSIYQLIKMKRMMAQVNFDISATHYSAKNYEKALEYGYKSLDTYRERINGGAKLGTAKDTLDVYACLGLIYKEMGNYEKALEFALDYLKVGKENNFGNTEMMLFSWVAGARFCFSGQIDSAELYFDKALSYPDENLDIEAQKYRTYMWLGNLHRLKGNLDSTIYYNRIAYEWYYEKGFLFWALYSSNMLGYFYYEFNELNTSEKYFLQSEKIFKEMIELNSWYRYDSLKYIVSYGTELYFPLSKRFMKEMMWEYGKMMYGMLYEINNKKKNTDKALEYLLAFKNSGDSLSKLIRNREIIEIQTKYESERKDQQIENLSKDNEFKDIRISQTRVILIGLAILLFIIIVLAIVLIRQNRLREQQKNVLIQQRLFRSQMNPHFIFNSLASIQSLIVNKDSFVASLYLTKFSDLVRDILESSTQEFVKFDKEIRTIENYLELQKVRFGEKFDFSIEVDESIDTEELFIPPMLLQPFIENSIEHGFKNIDGKGFIKLCICKSNNVILIELEDNGIGRDKAREILLKQNMDHKSLATNITQERIHILNKKLKKKIVMDILDLKDENNKAIGTKVTLEVPTFN